MANPQPTDAHLRIAHQISEQLMVSHFTAKQRRILDLILRLSWGCGKKQAIIPHQVDFEVIGIGKGHIKGELDMLIRDRVIVREGDTYWFNKDFDEWRVSRARGYSQEKLTELVSMNLKRLPNRELNDDERLPNRELKSSQNGNNEVTEMGTSSDTKSAMPKESLKKVLNKTVLLDELIINKESVLEVYQKEIGEPSEDMENEIDLACQRFTPEWVRDAIQEGVKRKAKSWRYIAQILENWKRYGRRNRGSPKKIDPDKYIKGKYGHLVRR